MNTSPEDNARDWLERMLIKLREGEATPDEVVQLRALLASDAEARRVYLRAKQMDTMLETVPMQQVSLPPAVKTPRASRGWKFAAFASAAAAVVAVAFIGLGRNGSEPRDRDALVAVLHSSFEAVIDGREVLEGDQPMRAGTYRLERGSVQLRFTKGAEVVIEGPAAFSLVDPDTMHLNQGNLWAHCPEEARGFAVRMPGGRELVDFGTEFGAWVDAGGGAQVKVMKGEVKIRDAVARTLDLTEGEAANWEVTAPPIEVNVASVKPFQSDQMLAEKVKAAPSMEQQTVVSFRDPKGGEWNRGENWSSGALPGAHALERAVINQSRVVRVLPGLSPPPHPVDIHVSNGRAPGTSVPDGVLEITGNMECQVLRIATADGANGVVRQTGGTVTVTESLLASSHQGAPERSVYELTDGSLNVGHRLVLGTRGPSQFTLKGSRSVITADRMNLGEGATLSFVLGSDGAGLIKLRDTLVQNYQASLIIDGAQYRGGARRLPLVVCGAALTDQGPFRPQQIQFIGFQGVTPRIAFHPGGIDLVLEPAR